METLVCARPECRKVAPRKTHNQKYCGDECCRIATNAKIMERYYIEKEKRSGKPRQCFNRCGQILSRYNHGDYCSKCSANKSSESKQRIIQVMENVW